MCDNEQVTSTTRTKRIRAAHRGAVTKLIGQMDEALLAADVGRLKQLKLSLMNKIAILSKLDEELLLSVAEDELDCEIEQADIVRDKAELSIIGLDEAIARCSKTPDNRPTLRQRLSSSSSSLEEEPPGLSHPSQATRGDQPDMLPYPSCQPYGTAPGPLSILPPCSSVLKTPVSLATVHEVLPVNTAVPSVIGDPFSSLSIGTSRLW